MAATSSSSWSQGRRINGQTEAMVPEQYATTFNIKEAQKSEDGPAPYKRLTNNLDVRPRYRDAAAYDHRLKSDSPLRDAGRPLTRASRRGKGRRLPVDDPRYFYDGFGIEGEAGDLIAVGSPDNVARVREVNVEEGVLTLDRALQWEAGAAVSLPWSGKRPDIGAYEHAPQARPHVRIDRGDFVYRPGDAVSMQAELININDPQAIAWFLGDGTRLTGRRIEHVFPDAGGYPIRLMVTDGAGQRHYATAYVDIVEPRQHGEPLVQSSFGLRDEKWWRQWKAYRPGDAYSETTVEVATNGEIHISAPEDGSLMPLRIHPPDWDIAQFPILAFRYRIQPGTPMAVAVQGFATREAGGVRRHYLAATDGIPVEARQPLQADGEWHAVRLDVRSIREQFPQVDVLDGLHFGAVNRGEGVEAGDQYWIDYVRIIPEQ